jgi:protease-4
MCGGCDYLDIQQKSAEAMDAGAKGLMYMFDSPGGQVRGCPELAEYISNLGSKGISTEAFCDSRMCSAAYWLGSATNHITATSSADIGSIGVILPWVDKGKVWEVSGIKWEPIVNEGATLKGAGGGPSLTPEQMSYLQETVNDVAGEFHDFVEAHREDLDRRVFKAGTFFGKKAFNLGLIDEVGSYQKAYDSLLSRVKGQGGGSGRPVPAAETNTGTSMTKEEEQAIRLKERERLSALDKLAYTPECKAIVEKAKADGKEASDIALQIVELVAQDKEIDGIKKGVREGAETGKHIKTLDPEMGESRSDEQGLSKRLVAVFAKRHPEMRQYLN